MLVRRGKVWSAKLRIAGTQVWKSLQTSDFELAVVRLRWLQASVTATRFEQKTATHEGLIVTIKQNLDAIVRQWAQEQLEVTEQAKAESSGFDPSDLDDQKDVYGDLLEAAHEHLTESHKWSVAGIADELVAKHDLGLDQASPQYQRLCRDLLRARVDVLAEEMRRVDGTYPKTQSFVAALLTQSPRRRDEAEETVKPVPVGPSIAATFADYMREHAHRRTQAQIEANLKRFLAHANLKESASVYSITKPLISAWKAKRLTEVSASTTARNLRLLVTTARGSRTKGMCRSILRQRWAWPYEPNAPRRCAAKTLLQSKCAFSRMRWSNGDRLPQQSTSTSTTGFVRSSCSVACGRQRRGISGRIAFK